MITSNHPACNLCRGACCESVIIAVPDPSDQQWLDLHGTPTEAGTMLRCRCSKLRPDGLCGIYETRPKTCRVFEPGCVGCRLAIRELRPWLEAELTALLP